MDKITEEIIEEYKGTIELLEILLIAGFATCDEEAHIEKMIERKKVTIDNIMNGTLDIDDLEEFK